MIRVGLNSKEKQTLVDAYVDAYKIKKVFCFYYKKFKPVYKVNCDIEYIEYADIEMYKYFYRLLEEIGKDSLIVMDGCLRTQNRSELIYNCAHHYLNQTDHHIIFELLPFIESKDDMMILLDFETPGKFKGKSFDYSFLQTEDVKIKPYRLKLNVINVEASEKEKKVYEKKRDKLFDELGMKDPETVPRALQLFAGDCKKKYIEADKIYIARNKRHKLENVLSYNDELKKNTDYIIIDTHFRKLDMIDFIKQTGLKKLNYMATPLTIDTYLITDFTKWIARMEAIYAKANLY